jgi:hypothetical protein
MKILKTVLTIILSLGPLLPGALFAAMAYDSQQNLLGIILGLILLSLSIYLCIKTYNLVVRFGILGFFAVSRHPDSSLSKQSKKPRKK